ncbi:MAG: hypothetical protein WBP13_05905 [Methylophilaceae bacterium]
MNKHDFNHDMKHQIPKKELDKVMKNWQLKWTCLVGLLIKWVVENKDWRVVA